MSDSVNRFSELDRLLCDVSDGAIDDLKLKRLDELLSGDSEALAHYVDYIDLYAALTRQPAIWVNEDGKREGWTSGSDSKATLFSNSHDQPRPVLPLLSTTLPSTVGWFSLDWCMSYMIATVIVGIGALIGSRTPAFYPQQMAKQSPVPSRTVAEPKTELVGRITGMVDCKWAGTAFDAPGVPLGRKYELASGLVEITYDTGAKIILQGPVTYEVESGNGGYLAVGKLTARVEKGSAVSGQQSQISNPQSLVSNSPLSTIHYPLFTVRTPTAVVTDLGTEFGVEVDKQGGTTSYVFRGSVRLQGVFDDGKTEAVAQVLHENESARVESGNANGITLLGASAKPANFVRQIFQQNVKTFDLVDVVAGGDGFSGRRNRGIDPASGRVVNTRGGANGELVYPVGDGHYHRVQGLPFVDGVFIPDGRLGSVQVDSAGHAFADFGKTSNVTSGYLWAGGEMPTRPPYRPSELGGVDYGSAGHGLLFLHANKAVTFNLEAIRRANPDYKLMRFRAAAGNTETVSADGLAVYADLWVLVDGQVRFQRREITGLNGAFSVAIPLDEHDRFLTLAATDSGNGIDWDWILFGDPRLELVPAKLTAGSAPRKAQ